MTGAGALGRTRISLANAFKQTEREPDPRRDSSEEQETPEGPTDGPGLEAWGRRRETAGLRGTGAWLSALAEGRSAWRIPKLIS